jgi:hypothetical protein
MLSFFAIKPRLANAAVLAVDKEEIAPLEEFARDEGERLRPFGADGAAASPE